MTTNGVVSILNVVPTVNITGPTLTAAGFATTYSLATTDPSPQDVAAVLLTTSIGVMAMCNWAFQVGDHVCHTHTHPTILVRIPFRSRCAIKTAARGAPDTLDVVVSQVAAVDGPPSDSGTTSADRIIIDSGSRGISLRINNKLYSCGL